MEEEKRQQEELSSPVQVLDIGQDFDTTADVAGDENGGDGGEQEEDIVNRDEGGLSEVRDPSLFDESGRLIMAFNVGDEKPFDNLVRCWRSTKGKAYVVDNLYGLLCSLALDNCKKEDKTKYFMLYPKLVTLFDAALETTFMDTFFADNLFYHPLFGNEGIIFSVFSDCKFIITMLIFL